MAFKQGHKQYLTFNLLNLTNSYAHDIKWQAKGQEQDVSTIGNNWEAFQQGQVGATIAVSGVWDSGTAATALDTVLFNALNGGGTKLYEYVPGGSASNEIMLKGNAFCAGYEIGGATKDKVGFSVTLRVADTPVRSTLA